MRKSILLCKILLLLITVSAAGQNVMVKVMEKKGQEALPYTDVEGVNFQGTTDALGWIRLEGGVVYTFSYLGYNQQTISLPADRDTFLIYLQSANFLLNTAVVSGNRSGERYMNAIAPLDIMPNSMITFRSTPDLSSILNRMPGVQIIDGQISIRGGAGYAYGAGSRVALLLNDIPMLQPDASTIPWKDLPFELIERTEIWKGAAATLYGSNALNGVIQLQTWPFESDTSWTGIQVASRVVGAPSDPNKKWYNDSRPSYWGHIVHKDLRGKFQWQGSARWEDLQTHLQGDEQERIRLSFISRYQFNKRWEIGFQSLMNKVQDNSFLYWKNAEEGAFIGAESGYTANDVLRVQIDPYIKYTSDKGNRHWLQSRIFYTENKASLNRSSSVEQYLVQYNYAHSLWQGRALWTSGALGQTFNSRAELFGNSDLWAYNAAIFTNYEHTFFKKLKISAGLRWEYNGQFPGVIVLGTDTLNANSEALQPLLSGGINYEVTKATSVSLHAGQGYRFPSIAEKFITTSLGQINISPNPDLIPEDGFSLNLSVKQGWVMGAFQNLFRLDLFWMEYDNMIEFGLRDPNLGFQALNIGDTDIKGVEVSLMGEADMRNFRWEYLLAYTYLDPKYETFDQDVAARSSADYNILKYRVRHQLTGQSQLSWRRWRVGLSALYNSDMEAIDSVLELFVVNGLASYRDSKSSAFLRWDASLGYQTNWGQLLLDIENIGNIEYSLRPGLIAMPRNISLQYSIKF